MGFRQTRTGRGWHRDVVHEARTGNECYLRTLNGYSMTVEHSTDTDWVGGVEKDGEYIDGEITLSMRAAMEAAVRIVDYDRGLLP